MTTYDILGIGAEPTSSAQLFGIAIDDAGATQGAYSFTVGSTLSFAGAGTAPVDVNEFQSGATAFTDWNNDVTTNQGTLPGTFNVGGSASVPAAPTLALALLGLTGIAGLRRRHRAT